MPENEKKYDYKSARERLEKTLPDLRSVSKGIEQFFIDETAIINQRKGVNEFMKLALGKMGDRRTFNRDELADWFEEYAGLFSTFTETPKGKAS